MLRWPEKQGYAGDLQNLAAAWDKMVLRHGDKAALTPTPTASASSMGAVWTHPNTYSIGGLVRGAFCEVGSSGRTLQGEVHVDGARHGVEMMQTMCGLIQHMYGAKEQGFLRKLMVTPAACCLRHHDSTPMFLRFGKLGKTPRGNRPVLEEGCRPPRCVCQVDHNPRRAPQMGVLEIFVQFGEVSYMEAGAGETENAWIYQVQPLTVAPCVLMRGTASCIYDAVDKGTALTLSTWDDLFREDPEKVRHFFLFIYKHEIHIHIM